MDEVAGIPVAAERGPMRLVSSFGSHRKAMAMRASDVIIRRMWMRIIGRCLFSDNLRASRLVRLRPVFVKRDAVWNSPKIGRNASPPQDTILPLRG